MVYFQYQTDSNNPQIYFTFELHHVKINTYGTRNRIKTCILTIKNQHRHTDIRLGKNQ